MNLVYEAVDARGKHVRDELAASSVKEAVESLRSQGLFVTQITPQEDSARSSKRGGTRSAAVGAKSSVEDLKLPTKQLVLFTRQMAMLLKSGSALVPALVSISRQMKRKDHARMVESMKDDLEEGVPLTQAMRRFPRTFDATYCAVVAAGESSATLPEMFERMAILVGKRRAMRNKLVGAMIYPMLLIVLSMKILAVMMFFVVPRFAGMFETLGVQLPATTRLMMSTATYLRSWGVFLAVGVAAAVVAAVWFMRSDAGAQFAANLQTRLVVLGRLMSRLIQAKTFRILGMLLEARVGLLDALSLARGVTRNDQYQKLYDALEEAVTKGESVTRAMDENRLVDPAIVQAVRTGEHSGRLGESITYVADVLDEENTELLNAITKLVEPVILILMGVVVGTVAISLFMPLFDMTAAV